MSKQILTNEIREKFGITAYIETIGKGSDICHIGYISLDNQTEFVGSAYDSAERIHLISAINARCSELVIKLSVQTEGFNAAPDGTPANAEQACRKCGNGENEAGWFCVDCRIELEPCTCGTLTCPACSAVAYAPVQVGDQGSAVAQGFGAMAEMANRPLTTSEATEMFRCSDEARTIEAAAPAPSFREKAQAAIQAVRNACLDKARWLVAVEKAAEELEAGRWSYHDGGLKIQSRTQSDVTYLVDSLGCSCLAARRRLPCWHRAALRILVKASEGQR